MVRYYNPHESALRSLFRWRFTLTWLVELWRGRIGWWHFLLQQKWMDSLMERVLPIFKNEGFTYSVCLPEGASLDLGKHCILQTWNDFTSGTRGNLERSDLHFLMKMRGTSKLDSWAVDEHQKIYTTDIHRWWAKRLGVVGCMIIWLQKDGWQLASGKFLGLFVDGSPKNWGLQFFKWANSGYTWSVLWWYLGWWGWWATTGWSIMSCHGKSKFLRFLRSWYWWTGK